MAYQIINNAESGLSVRNKLHNNFNELYTDKLELTTSEIISTAGGEGLIIPSPDASVGGLEIVHLGDAGVSDAKSLLTAGILRNAWAMAMYHNLTFDRTLHTYGQDSASYPSSWLEAGTEGVTLHAIPAGTDIQNSWHETFQSRAVGVDTQTSGRGPTTGVYNQFKAPLIAIYEDSAYTADSHAWQGGSTRADIPFIHLITPVGKGTNYEAITLEANSAVATGLGFHFKKSRGTYGTKTAIAADDFTGLIVFAAYDGSAYQNTARICARATAGGSAGVAPQKLLFQTSATNTAGLTTHIEINENGNIIMATLPTSSAGLASGTLWNDAGTLKVA